MLTTPTTAAVLLILIAMLMIMETCNLTVGVHLQVEVHEVTKFQRVVPVMVKDVVEVVGHVVQVRLVVAGVVHVFLLRHELVAWCIDEARCHTYNTVTTLSLRL